MKLIVVFLQCFSFDFDDFLTYQRWFVIYYTNLCDLIFSEKGTINLHRSDIELNILCPEECDQYHVKQYHYDYNNDFNIHFNDNQFNANQYVELEDEYDCFNRNQYEIEKVTDNYDYINDKADTVLNDFHNFNQSFDYFKYNEEIPQINNVQFNKNNENICFNYDESRTNDYSNVFNQNNFDIPLDDYENQIKHNIINQTCVETLNNDSDKINDAEINYSENDTNINETIEKHKERTEEKVSNEIKDVGMGDDNNEDEHFSNNETQIDSPASNNNDENHNDILNNSVNSQSLEDIEIVSIEEAKTFKKKKKGFKKIVLSLEEQKKELERNRKSKNYIESEFKCYNCAIGFLFKDTYQAHMMRHEEVSSLANYNFSRLI